MMANTYCYYVLFSFSFSFHLSAMDSDLFALVRAGDVQSLSQVLTPSINVMHYVDTEQNSLLHCAATREVAALLLNRGAQVNALNGQQSTPLHVMLWHGSCDDFSLAQLLLDAGADITALNVNKQNPVHGVVSKAPAFVRQLFTHVPRCAIERTYGRECKKMLFTLLCVFKRFPQLFPKDIQSMLLSYCKRPPYQPCNEHEMVNALLFEKLDTIQKVLITHDNREFTPGDLELRYWPEDRSRLLNPLMVHQFVPDIIASIARLVDLKLTYTLDNKTLRSNQTPSTEQ